MERDLGRVEMFYEEPQEDSFKRCCFSKELRVVSIQFWGQETAHTKALRQESQQAEQN